jgi:predicted metalloprotease with PDZ domain
MDRFHKQQQTMEFLTTKLGNNLLNTHLQYFTVFISKNNLGLGITLYSEDVTIYSPKYKLVYPIIKIDQYSAADYAGLKNGMRIIAVNSEFINDKLKSLKEVFEAIITKFISFV